MGLLAWVLNVWATPSPVEISYVEPTANTDGSPLDDLAFTEIWYQIAERLPVLATEITASALNGGGRVTTILYVPVGMDQISTVQFWTTAVDTSGHTSQTSTKVMGRGQVYLAWPLTGVAIVTDVTGIA